MDNEELDGVKFSEFPSQTPGNSDEVVGLHSGDNARFSIANIVAAVRQGLASIFVPLTRTINSKALSSNITLNASDVGAVDADSVGIAGGVASLDSTGKVPSSQLPPIASTAEDVTYDNTQSGLTAENVQDAIDELAAGAGGGGVDPETIAPVEESSTATTAHPLGTVFYVNNLLYRALADIPVGGTINTSAGGNATQTSIAQNFKRTVTLTSAEYAQLSAAEKAADIVYIVTDDNTIPAEDVSYDPTTSGLTATNVQDAIDEVVDDLDSKQDTLSFDATPTANSTNPVQSGGVYIDVRTRVPVNGMGKNLLDSWYFGNPVNQRGQSSYSGEVYGIDRWFGGLSSSAMTVNADSISFSAGFWNQYLDITRLKTGKTHTLSVLFKNGNFYTISGIIPAATSSQQTVMSMVLDSGNVSIVIPTNGKSYVRFAGTNSDLLAVKLELGTEQTLAHQENDTWVLNEIPDYEYELYRCITSTADSSDAYSNKTLATEQQLGYPESGTTASRNYSAGEYICWNGLTYTANQAISSGTTLNAGTGGNLTECVGGGFNAVPVDLSASVTFNSSAVSSIVCELDVIGKLAVFSLTINLKSLSTLQGVELAYLPSRAYPVSEMNIVGMFIQNFTSQNSGAQPIRVYLDSAGKLRCPNHGGYAGTSSTTNSRVYLSFAYYTV